MTEFSFPWSNVVAGDGGASSYTLAVVEDTNKFLQNLNPATDGVVYWTESPNASLLAPSNPAGSTVRVASGVGMVEGWLYTNDADVDFDINAAPGNASATDIIVLQRILASQTVRLARIGGAAASKAVLTQTAATWEIPIVDVVLDGSGNFSSITDARKLALPPGTIVKLGESVSPGGVTVSFSSIPSLFSNLRIVGRARVTRAALVADIDINFNGLATSIDYDYIVDSQFITPASQITAATAQTAMRSIFLTGATGTANYFDGFEILIPAYVTAGYKTILTKSSQFGSAAVMATAQGTGWWKKTEPITSISLTDDTGWATGSQITLYGEA